MKDTPKPSKRCKYYAAFRAEALRLAVKNRSTQTAARTLNIDPERRYQWQKAALTPVAASLGQRWTRPRPPNCARLQTLARQQA